jgi:hypothetical protein
MDSIVTSVHVEQYEEPQLFQANKVRRRERLKPCRNHHGCGPLHLTLGRKWDLDPGNVGMVKRSTQTLILQILFLKLLRSVHSIDCCVVLRRRRHRHPFVFIPPHSYRNNKKQHGATRRRGRLVQNFSSSLSYKTVVADRVCRSCWLKEKSIPDGSGGWSKDTFGWL